MKKCRWLDRLRATRGGYFWLPCPLCGENFGGHESSGASIITGWGSGQGVCPNCVVEAEKHNQKVLKSTWYVNAQNEYYAKRKRMDEIQANRVAYYMSCSTQGMSELDIAAYVSRCEGWTGKRMYADVDGGILFVRKRKGKKK